MAPSKKSKVNQTTEVVKTTPSPSPPALNSLSKVLDLKFNKEDLISIYITEEKDKIRNAINELNDRLKLIYDNRTANTKRFEETLNSKLIGLFPVYHEIKKLYPDLKASIARVRFELKVIIKDSRDLSNVLNDQVYILDIYPTTFAILNVDAMEDLTQAEVKVKSLRQYSELFGRLPYDKLNETHVTASHIPTDAQFHEIYGENIIIEKELAVDITIKLMDLPSFGATLCKTLKENTNKKTLSKFELDFINDSKYIYELCEECTEAEKEINHIQSEIFTLVNKYFNTDKIATRKKNQILKEYLGNTAEGEQLLKNLL